MNRSILLGGFLAILFLFEGLVSVPVPIPVDGGFGQSPVKPFQLHEDESIVQTSLGLVKGTVQDDHRQFLGVPFAAPPVNALRWKPTQPAKSWGNTVYDATQYSSGCPQRCKLPPHTCPETQSEDCLYLNVWTPRLAHLTTPQPVMVFLPGGHFEQGGAGVTLYDGSYIVNSSSVILVTTNYRLGALGWVAINDQVSGNYGLMDQRMALQWVQQNIASFGGDPNQITLFGQSAGATSIAAHLMSSVSAGLFQRAIVESDPIVLPMQPFPDAAKIGSIFVNDIGCGDNSTVWDCLSTKSIEEILDAQYAAEKHINLLKPLELFLPWTPVLNGADLTMQPLDAFAQGSYNKMPVILGSVSEDAYMFIYMAAKKKLNTVEYTAAVGDVFLTAAPDVLVVYPPKPLFGDKRPALGVLGTDYIFLCSGRNGLESMANHTPNSVWFYQFNHVLSFDAWGPDYPFCVGHVCHGAELPFIFNSVDKTGIFNFTAAEEVLSKSMVAYWTNFARTGNPNKGATPVAITWPAYDSANRNNIEFQTPTNVIAQNVRGSYCDFWDSEGYSWGW